MWGAPILLTSRRSQPIFPPSPWIEIPSAPPLLPPNLAGLEAQPNPAVQASAGMIAKHLTSRQNHQGCGWVWMGLGPGGTRNCEKFIVQCRNYVEQGILASQASDFRRRRCACLQLNPTHSKLLTIWLAVMVPQSD